MLRTIGLICLLAVMVNFSLSAQKGRHGHFLPELTEEVKTKLNLSSEQTTALETLKQRTGEQLRELHDRNELDHEGRRAAKHQILQKAKVSRDDILNEDQLAQLKVLRAEQRAAHRERRSKVDRKALRSELREYDKTTIRPVMKAQRALLEEKLAADDRQQLKEIRAELKTARQAAKAEHREKTANREHVKHDRGGHGKHHGGKHHRHHKGQRLADNHPEAFAALSEMIVRYDGDISRLLEELEPQHEEWRTAKRAILERHLPEGGPERIERRQPHDKREGEHAERHVLMRKIHFLLRNPDAGSEETAAPVNNADFITARTYPNPAANTTTLAFELTQPLQLVIEIKDEKGNSLRMVTRDQFAEGSNQLEVDLSDLRSGTYYLTFGNERFTTPESVKIVVVK